MAVLGWWTFSYERGTPVLKGIGGYLAHKDAHPFKCGTIPA